MQVVLAEPAERGFARIIDYIAQDNPVSRSRRQAGDELLAADLIVSRRPISPTFLR